VPRARDEDNFTHSRLAQRVSSYRWIAPRITYLVSCVCWQHPPVKGDSHSAWELASHHSDRPTSASGPLLAAPPPLRLVPGGAAPIAACLCPV